MIAIKTRTLGVATAAILFGGIALGAALGYWNTSSTKEPVKIKSGEFAGMPSPSDIRGSYTWADVAKAFSIPEASVIKAFDGSGSEEKVNSLESRYAGRLPDGTEIGTDSVRFFVSLYTGLPHEIEEGTILPKSAIAVLRAEGRAESALIDAAEARAIGSGGALGGQSTAAAPSAAAPSASAPSASAPSAVSAEHAPAVGSIVGKTTFADLKSWGYDMAKVEEILGGIGPSAQAIRDYCSAKGLAFSEIKAKLEGIAPK